MAHRALEIREDRRVVDRLGSELVRHDVLHPVAVADVDRPVEVLALLDVVDRLLRDAGLLPEKPDRARHETHAPEDDDARRKQDDDAVEKPADDVSEHGLRS